MEREVVLTTTVLRVDPILPFRGFVISISLFRAYRVSTKRYLVSTENHSTPIKLQSPCRFENQNRINGGIVLPPAREKSETEKNTRECLSDVFFPEIHSPHIHWNHVCRQKGLDLSQNFFLQGIPGSCQAKQ